MSTVVARLRLRSGILKTASAVYGNRQYGRRHSRHAPARSSPLRRWLNSPDRLLYPMKRVGKRGEGKFEQISWDEAISTIADKLKYTIETYGNEAIYVNYATGTMHSATGNPGKRLLGLLGGYVNQGYDYSANMILAVMPYMYGSSANLDKRRQPCYARKAGDGVQPL